MPAEVAGERFYRPSPHGAEPALYAALETRRRTGDAEGTKEAGERPEGSR